MKSYETLSSAIDGLKSRGYTLDFNLRHDCLECKSVEKFWKSNDFHVDEVYRFEGMSNPDDSSILFAISISDGKKGTLVDAYGAYAESITQEMMDKLNITY
jgi:hypothetical protein